jgi:hypothetical protein
MAYRRRTDTNRPWEKPEAYQYRTRFGSHREMLTEKYQESFDTLQPKDKVVCSDEFGEYETEAGRIDSGLADPNRYRSSRVNL